MSTISVWDQVALSAFVSAFVAGLFLVGGYYYSRRLEKAREEEQTWQRVGMPVINAADDLVARLFDIFVRGRKLNLSSPLQPSESAVYDPSKELSTVWRLMHFFASAVYLEQHVADERAESRVSNLRFYANNKCRIPLKGNLFKASSPIQTEGQQLIGSKVISLGGSREIRDADFFRFVQCLKSDDELAQSADACRKCLEFSVEENPLGGQLLSIAQFTVYLIDLVQDLRPSSKWEEFRLYLVSLLRAHNATATGKRAFLYKRGDLESSDYFDTYNSLPGDKPKWYSLTRNANARKKHRLVARSKSGFPRVLSSSGVQRIMGSNTVNLSASDAPGEVRQQLGSLFK